MSIPMTTKVVLEKYVSPVEWNKSWGDYAEGQTCSFHCPKCKCRVWFYGDLTCTPETYICPYCKKENKNIYTK